jgi:cytochrome c-type biogenesis protein CcmE
MNRNKKFGIGATLLVGSIAYLVYAGVEAGSSYYFTIEEFAPERESLVNKPVRIAGRVTAGSLRKQTSAKGTEMKFSVGDFVGEGTNSSHIVPVHYTGIVPDMFAEGRDVIIEGKYADGVLKAQTIMTSCPSKYEAGKENPPGPPSSKGGERQQALNK